jgi:formylglycine-generating enzyme required for sulfatase activity
MDNKMVIKHFFLWGLSLFLFFSLSLKAADQKKESGTEKTDSFFSSSYALVIGINNYTNWTPLKNAVENADLVKAGLEAKGFKVIGNAVKKNPTFTELEKVFKNFFLNKTIKSNSRLFIWFSGYGHTIDGEGFLVPADAPGNNNVDFVRNAFPVRRFDELFRLTKARNIYMVFDSCFSSPIFVEGNTDAKPVSIGSYNIVRQFLRSGDKDQERLDDGFFRDAFIEALKDDKADANADSYLTAGEIGFFVIDKITTANYGKLKDFPGGDFVFSMKGKEKEWILISFPKMVTVPAGIFLMGDIQGGGYSNERPIQNVEVKSFAVGEHEVTFEEYDLFCAATGKEKPDDNEWGRGRRPVINVSWEDAVAYTKWLSGQTGHIYRLPTEAEWEYMARGGTNTKYWWGNELTKAKNEKEAKAPCYGCGATWGWDAERKTAPVGSFAKIEPKHPWGIYDTVGNVWEWTCSEYTDSYVGKETESIGSISTSMKSVVIRGGAWDEEPRNCRAAHRRSGYPDERSKKIGFRVVRELKK